MKDLNAHDAKLFVFRDNGPGDTHCEARDQGGNHLDRGSQYVLHLAKVNGGTFPSSQTVDFIGGTSHQDFAMISANQSLHWLFVNDYGVRYPDIVPHNPGDKTHKSKGPNPSPTPKAYATHGNEVLASALLGGSLLFVLAFFSILPLICKPNFDDKAFNLVTSNRYGTYSPLPPVVDAPRHTVPRRNMSIKLNEF